MQPISTSDHELLKQRLSNHEKISRKLDSLTEAETAELLKSGREIHSSMGARIVEIEGIPVFVKQIAVSDFELEHRSEDGRLSTANIFNLPTCYQYAFNSAGFGAGRELAAHEMTTNWVLSGECQNFPLTYGYKTVDRARSDDVPTEEDFKNVRKYWNDSEAVETRLRAIESATKGIMVFMEAIPQTLHSYIHPTSTESRVDMDMMEREIKSVTDFMASKNTMHFDAHSKNILTDGRHIYFADFGMFSSLDFELSDEEKKFFADNKGYDCAELVYSLCQHPKDESGRELPLVPEVREFSEKHKFVAKSFEVFRKEFRDDFTKSTTYPAKEIELALREGKSRPSSATRKASASPVSVLELGV